MDTLPVDYQGQFSPDMKSLALQLHQDDGITELALNRFFKIHSIYISGSTISKIITQDIALFHQKNVIPCSSSTIIKASHSHSYLARLKKLKFTISIGQLNNFLIEKKGDFHKEKDDLLPVAFSVSSYIHANNTDARHQGNNG